MTFLWLSWVIATKCTPHNLLYSAQQSRTEIVTLPDLESLAVRHLCPFTHVRPHLWHGRNCTDLLSQSDLFIYLSVTLNTLSVTDEQRVRAETLHARHLSTHAHTVPRSAQYGHFSSCVLHLLLLLMPVQYIDYCHHHNTGRLAYTSLLFLGCMLSSATAQTTEPDSCRSLF